MRDWLIDLAFVIGLLLLGAGVWAIHWPSALIVVGALLVLLSLIGTLRNGISEDDTRG